MTISTDLIAIQYREGASSRDIAATHGIAQRTALKLLREAGVDIRPPGPPQIPARTQVHRVVQQLHHVLGRKAWEVVKRSGLSTCWWRNARSGKRSPSLANIEALANAAGYELVLRRRLM